MRRDFAVKKTSKFSPSRRMTFISLSIVFILGILFAVYQYKKRHLEDASLFSAYLAHLSTWIKDHKTQLHPTIVKPKPSTNAEKSPEVEPIHFEFYTALPSMQVKGAETPAPEVVTNTAEQNKVITEPKQDTIKLVQKAPPKVIQKIIQKPKISVPKSATIAKSHSIFMNADELALDLSAQIKNKPSIHKTKKENKI